VRILLTGAGGRVGAHLLPALAAHGHEVTALDRKADYPLPRGCRRIVTGLSEKSDFSRLLDRMDIVVHLADGFNAHEHLPVSARPPLAWQQARATRALALAAAGNGICTIYLSTIKTMCASSAREVLSESTAGQPQSLYGLLKLEAEETLRQAGRKHGTRVNILRFPIVFGAGIGGNMERLRRLLDSPLPLPLAGIDNRRSLISVESLVEAVCRLIHHGQDQGGTFVVHDGSMTTSALARTIRTGLGRPTRLFRLPRPLWRAGETLPLARGIAGRLHGSLEIDDRVFRQRFSWRPGLPLEERIGRWARLEAARGG